MGISDSGPPAGLRIPLSRRAIALLLGLAVLGAALTLLATAWRGVASARYAGWLVGQLKLTSEHTVATWFASLLLLAVSLAALLCFRLDPASRDAGARPWLRYGWLALAAVFALLSLDELGSLHERLGSIEGLNPLGVPAEHWVGVLAVPIGAVALYLALFALSWARRHPAAAALALLGVACYLSVPFQEELEVATVSAAADDPDYRRPNLLRLLEEGAELLGTLCFLAGALLVARSELHRESHGAGVHGDELELRLPVTPHARRIARFLLGLVVALAVATEILARTVRPPEQLGFPVYWFGSTALLFAAFALLLARAGLPPGPGPSRASLAALAAFLGVVALDCGSGFALTRDLAEGSPRLETALRSLAAAAGALLAARAAILLPPGRLRRPLLLLAAALTLAPFLDESPAAATLFTAALAAGYMLFLSHARPRTPPPPSTAPTPT